MFDIQFEAETKCNIILAEIDAISIFYPLSYFVYNPLSIVHCLLSIVYCHTSHTPYPIPHTPHLL
jgi:hypothetical protein